MRALVLLALVALAPTAASLPPATQDACPDAPQPALFVQWTTQLENLAFDGDLVHVSDLGGDRLLTFDRAGALVGTRAIPGMHGVTLGPDGALYVGAAGTGGPEVWRVEDDGFTTVASGFTAANGLAFDAEGNLFVSSPLATQGPYLYRLPAGDMAAWSAWGDEYGTNGLWRDGDTLLAAVTGEQSSRILRISTQDATDVELVAELSLGVATLQPGAHAPSGPAILAPKGLDDLTLGPDGMIYVAAHVTGELLRVDPATGAACVLASGLEEPTSVRVGWDGDLYVTDMGGVGVTALFGPGAGAVWRLDL